MFRVVGEGRLTTKPEIAKTTKGTSVTNVSLASEDFRANQKVTDFYRVEVWNHDADFLGKYADKGDTLFVDGRLAQVKWTDREGNKRSEVKIICQNMSLHKKFNRDNEQTAPVDNQPVNNQPVTAQPEMPAEPETTYTDPDFSMDDLPF